MRLDLEGFSNVWERTLEEDILKHLLVRGFTNTLHSSTRIERPEGGKPKSPNLKVIVKKWT
ncbi:uncharacterized protein RCC_03427 [Ramularia collo-cygni]|uniref:Uncharacterized protein n=1 Tax=Ramularia collo-cygni TaxID=112498 RepID=A0A2D3VAW0_9PEZI|nr:uncharacterized protein RCC_03427 [Ramularia collo-cygni]CZT17593.1 uncharacterized protein RCC_03427 [Ramularia collo-cygni]